VPILGNVRHNPTGSGPGESRIREVGRIWSDLALDMAEDIQALQELMQGTSGTSLSESEYAEDM